MSERSVYRLAVNVLVILCVTLEAGVQVSSQHDADLNGAKGLADACEFHGVPPKLRSLSCFESSQGRT